MQPKNARPCRRNPSAGHESRKPVNCTTGGQSGKRNHKRRSQTLSTRTSHTPAVSVTGDSWRQCGSAPQWCALFWLFVLIPHKSMIPKSAKLVYDDHLTLGDRSGSPWYVIANVTQTAGEWKQESHHCSDCGTWRNMQNSDLFLRPEAKKRIAKKRLAQCFCLQHVFWY